jgi:dihydroflavonol-4-reductase
VTRQLVARGDTVRAVVRPTSKTSALDGLAVELVRAELFDDAALREAMRGVRTVFYCVVDARPTRYHVDQLFRTNVTALRHALDAAVDAGVRFVICSTIGTIGRVPAGLADETTRHNWLDRGGAYIRSRVEAEELVLRYHREFGLDAVVLNPSTTFGPDDYGPVQHGRLIEAVVQGKMPAYVRGQAMEVVDVRDAARAFLLAEDRGVSGERYIVSERMMSTREIFAAAAEAVGRRPARIGIPLAALKLVGRVGDVIGWLRKEDQTLTSESVRLMYLMSPLDHGKAGRDLDWQPGPTERAIRDHARFVAAHRFA